MATNKKTRKARNRRLSARSSVGRSASQRLLSRAWATSRSQGKRIAFRILSGSPSDSSIFEGEGNQ